MTGETEGSRPWIASRVCVKVWMCLLTWRPGQRMSNAGPPDPPLFPSFFVGKAVLRGDDPVLPCLPAFNCSFRLGSALLLWSYLTLYVFTTELALLMSWHHEPAECNNIHLYFIIYYWKEERTTISWRRKTASVLSTKDFIVQFKLDSHYSS